MQSVYICESGRGGYRCLQEKTGFLNCVLSKQKDVGEAKYGKLVSLSPSHPPP